MSARSIRPSSSGTKVPAPSDGSAVAFGPFRLYPERGLLFEGEKPLQLGSRALDLLSVLVEHPGALVTKEDLVARVWPGTFVVEGNLRVHMAALRRALGDGQSGRNRDGVNMVTVGWSSQHLGAADG